MSSNRILLLLICYTITFFSSCNGQSHDQLKKDKQELSDTTLLDIPPDYNTSSFKRTKDDIQKKVGLSSIENGFESLQVRIWMGYSLNDTEQLIIIKETDSIWSAEFYSLIFNYNNKYNDSLISITKDGGIIQPLSGWKIFADKLLRSKILELPDYSKIEHYNVGLDPDGLTVEIARKNKYRIYSYPNLSSYKNKIPEAKDMDEIMKFIKAEFSLTTYR